MVTTRTKGITVANLRGTTLRSVWRWLMSGILRGVMENMKNNPIKCTIEAILNSYNWTYSWLLSRNNCNSSRTRNDCELYKVINNFIFWWVVLYYVNVKSILLGGLTLFDLVGIWLCLKMMYLRRRLFYIFWLA